MPWDDQPTKRSGGNGGWIAIAGAVVIVFIIVGLFLWDGDTTMEKAAEAKRYGECSVYYHGKQRFALECQNLNQFHAAVDEFAKKNPSIKIKGIYASNRE